MILIKFGGSVITDKSKYHTFNAEYVKNMCNEIRESGKKIIIVHGAGSFGHILAKKNNLDEGYSCPTQIPAVAQVCYDVRELNSMVVKELNNAGIPAVSVPTGSCFMMKNKKLIMKDVSVLKSLYNCGIMPVMFGDVVMDEKLRFGICSGDQIIEKLTKIFNPSRVIFVSDVDGLYDDDPQNNPNARLIKELSRSTFDKVSTDITVTDVTGGIREKIETMFRICSDSCDCVLVNGTVKGRLLSLLNGEKVMCTTIRRD
ncbi:MAG: isopentenyl phosphate kinase [archaeon]|nr:isopentenyl phosphate kinase [archaeon]